MTSIETRIRSGRDKVRRTASPALTDAAIKAMKAPQVRADGAIPPGAGRLKVRKRRTTRGTVVEWLFIWRSQAADGSSTLADEKRLSTMTLGRYTERYTEAQKPGDYLTLTKARERARELQEQVRAGLDPAMVKEAERHERGRDQAASVFQLRESQKKTLQAMLDAYVADLIARGKVESAYDARNMFANHVTAAFPETAAMPAAEVKPEHISEILARLARPKDGTRAKGRTALKLRSYIGAAFKLALGASTDPMAPSEAAGFGLSINPAAAVPAVSMARAFNRAGTRVLSVQELRAYMARLDEVPSMVNRLALQLHLAAGGQRLQQLLRLTNHDIGEATFTLYDGKGRRAQARAHVLPLLPELVELLAQLSWLAALGDPNPTGSLFLGRGGSVVNPETLSGEVAAISSAMVEAKEASLPFRLGDIRRTCETMMAEVLGISKDTRAQLLSHGISGVQAVHYDKGEHLEAKANALHAWNAYLEDVRSGRAMPHGKVIQLRRKAA